MFKKSLALILLTVLVLTSFVIPAYADSAIGSEEIEDITQPTDTTIQLKESYTQEELNAILAHSYDINVPDGGLDFTDENFPLEQNGDVSLMATTSTSTDYYIALTSDGKLVSSPNSNTVTKSSYSSSSSTNAMLQWTFEEISDNVYVIRKKNSPTTCIAAVPSSNSIITKTYAAGDTNCHWSIRVMSMGSVICSASSNSAANGKYFYYSGGKFVLSSSSYTEFGLIDVDWWVPATTITTPAQVVPLNGTAVITGITSSPSVANLVTDQWLNVTFANSSICSINGNWSLVGETLATTTATMTHKITGVSCTFNVHVGYGTHLRIYYDNAFETKCKASDVTPTTRINNLLQDVRIKFASDLNIALIIVRIQKEASYPEMDSTNCSAADYPDLLCSCSDSSGSNNCSNSGPYHHKNIYNIHHETHKPTGNYISLFITGHRVCDVNDEDTTCSAGAYGLATRADKHATVTANYVDINDGKLKKTIAHEIGHLFQNTNDDGLDHYGIGSVLGSDNSKNQYRDCIYGEDKDESYVYGILKTCPSCTAVIRSNANRYNIYI